MITAIQGKPAHDAAWRHVAVIGGGTMGVGIAHAALLVGANVELVETSVHLAHRSLHRIADMLERSVERGNLEEPSAVTLGRLGVHSDVAELQRLGGSEGIDLAIEAVPEDATLKASVLSRVEDHLDPRAVLATNTSSISIAKLATAVRRPSRFLGLHFFNPVPSSLMVEVVTSPATDPGVLTSAISWVTALGKESVVIRDAPGFASSRLGVLLSLEAMRMVEEGVATAEDIDRAMVLGYRHPIGPLRLTDLVGLDVRLGIADYLHETLGERFAAPQVLRHKVSAGQLGRKTGRGFFSYD